VFFSRDGAAPVRAAEMGQLVIQETEGKVRYFLANVDCAIYFEEGRRDELVEPMTAAMRALENGLQ
jgi:hypothetical protein